MPVSYEKEWKQALKECQKHRVFLLFSKEEYPLRQFAEQTQSWLEEHEQTTAERFPGPAPDMGAVTDAAGMLSFFGTRRVIVLPLVEPQALSDGDAALLASMLEEAENSVFVITILLKDDRSAKSKKWKQLLEAAQKNGFCAEAVSAQEKDAKQLVIRRAKALSTAISDQAAQLLAERCGIDLFLLESETDKLAAACGYTEITPQLISELSTVNMEADVFELVNLVERRQQAQALQKLNQLFELQHDPIAVTAVLCGTFADLYRVKCAYEMGKTHEDVYRDFQYKGSPYRLKKASQAAARYQKAQLRRNLSLLLDLDTALKRSAADKAVLVQTALCEMMQEGAR